VFSEQLNLSFSGKNSQRKMSNPMMLRSGTLLFELFHRLVYGLEVAGKPLAF
jgi:hypothetical protein